MKMNKIADMSRKASLAARKFAGVGENYKNNILEAIKIALINNIDTIKKANYLDVDKAKINGKDKTFIDRLTLTESRIKAMAQGLDDIIKLKDPVGEIVNEYTNKAGLIIRQTRAPLGVIAIIYEARPNVTVDCVALTIKSGNAVILRGSKDAINSNRALYLLIDKTLDAGGFDRELVQFVDDESRESSSELLKQSAYIDVVIPRGGDKLKEWVTTNATMPVIASAGGNCHAYIEKTADIDKAIKIVLNAKVQRPSVCNALEQLIVDKEIAEEFLPLCCQKLKKTNVKILGCNITQSICPDIEKATDKDYYTEHLDYKISIKVVGGIDEAIEWINEHNTKHSECIVTQDQEKAKKFTDTVDAAALYVNASTRFTDGFEFGLGAEMGISTQKLHARGPIGLKELTSVKYVVLGNGQIRE